MTCFSEMVVIFRENLKFLIQSRYVRLISTFPVLQDQSVNCCQEIILIIKERFELMKGMTQTQTEVPVRVKNLPAQWFILHRKQRCRVR